MGSTGPIFDLDAVCEMLGITIYRATLGADLNKAPSGAFVDHPDVGLSILVNLDMRYLRVSWPTALERLRQMNAITADTYQNLRHSVRPVSLARSLGYVSTPRSTTPTRAGGESIASRGRS